MTGLSKRYGTTVALDELSMTVERGEIFGFLGANGAGKTTAVKLLLGLVRPSGGTATLLGRPIDQPDARRSVGYLPELFRYQPWLRAREVVALHAALGGAAPRAATAGAIGDVLDRVGLADRADDAVGGFSKGMQQRLGLAVALVGRPALVILDEPTSALDPVGRADIRTILRDVRDGGATIFLNSHLLTEVERVCDRVAVVDRGRIVAEGRLDDLLAEATVRIRATDLDPAARAGLGRFGRVEDDGDWMTFHEPTAEAADIVAAAVGAGGRVHAVESGRGTLEERFFELIGRGHETDAARRISPKGTER
jgi:ABC-2 type transport system ATP-binding protein